MQEMCAAHTSEYLAQSIAVPDRDENPEGELARGCQQADESGASKDTTARSVSSTTVHTNIHQRALAWRTISETLVKAEVQEIALDFHRPHELYPRGNDGAQMMELCYLQGPENQRGSCNGWRSENCLFTSCLA